MTEWKRITDKEWKAYKNGPVTEADVEASTPEEAKARARMINEARDKARAQAQDLAAAVTKARAEAHLEFMVVARQQDILKIVQTRHGALPASVAAQLAVVREPTRLDALFDVALTGTREDFLQRLVAD